MRSLIIINKSWEADALGEVITSAKARPASYVPDPGNKKGLRFLVERGSGCVEFWCIQDLLPADVNPSSTNEKWKVLPSILKGPTPDLVVAFGTAAWGEETSYNGCVLIGTRAFAHNPFASDPAGGSGWTHEDCDRVLFSSLDPHQDSKRFRLLIGDASVRADIELRLLTAPNNPATVRTFFAASNYAALSDVNVINYDDFAWADPESVFAFRRHAGKSPLGSLETTHAVIRLASEAPFMFISGFANRIGRFNQEAATKDYAQNFVAAHNAAVVAAWLVPQILSLPISEGE
jgi:hypothetical protein